MVMTAHPSQQTSAIPGASTNGSAGSTEARRTVSSYSPLDGHLIATYPTTDPEALPGIVARARVAQKRWEAVGLRHRLRVMRAIQDSLYRHLDSIMDALVNEIGKARWDALIEVFPALELLAYQNRIATKTLQPHERAVLLVPHRRHFVEYRAYGVVAVITPWNFPLLLSTTPIFAALTTGNAVVFKPSEYAPRVGELIANVVYEAGLDPDLMPIVYGYGDVGAALIKARPDKVAFTGSVATGRRVAAMAGELLIPCTLELGGKDAAIVLADADIRRSANGIAWAALHNAGQACLSIERIYVERPIAATLTEAIQQVIDKHVRAVPGPGQERSLTAITNDAQLKIIEGQVNEAVAQGARVLAGGHRLEGPGRFYAPTVITDVTPGMRIVQDETFGPVIVIIPVEDAEEALRLANDSRFGLTASVWTRDRERGLALARRMRAGSVSVNDHIMSASVPQQPWGGVHEAGYGRQRGPEGLLDMVYPQSLSVDRVSLPTEPYWYPYTAQKYNLLLRILRIMYGDSAAERIAALFGRRQ
jgi:acyl-CoA reductase-like NAD-dependent aldehyde dehydrogenase